MQARVECYAGYRGAENPRRFHIAGRAIEVAEVVDRWQEPERRCFTVRGDDGARYRLIHHESDDGWTADRVGWPADDRPS
jgi:hypothetical protein